MSVKKIKADWRPRAHYPNLLKTAKVISYDVETYDPNLLKSGPGALRKDGYICGFSLATDDGFCGYYPIKHDGGDNLENPDGAIRWLRDMLATDIPKIGANILYDDIWMRCDLGVTSRGKKWDIQVAEPLLDENRWTYSLDSLAETYLGQHKVEDLLYRVGVEMLGLTPKKPTGKRPVVDLEAHNIKDIISQVKGRLWELPARYVGEYGEGDALLPIQIFEKQRKLLEERGLWSIFNDIEAEVLNMLLEMWIRGVPVDVAKGEQVRDQLRQEQDVALRKLRHRAGMDIDIWSADSISEAAKKLGLEFPVTEKDNPSFKAEWLQDQDNQFFKLLLEARQLDRSGGVFIEEKILNLSVNGLIHPQFWQVKTDNYGTGSGRFSSSNPNAQQFPARNERLAKLVRGIIVPNPGCQFGVFDYSQQEPRVTIHYAALRKLPGAEEAQQQYINNPATDYHQMVAAMTGLERKVAKSVNLGLSYGMGPKKFAEKYGFTMAEAKAIYGVYHKGLPFIRELTSLCENTVKRRGYIKTLLGRHCHFDKYGPPQWTDGVVPKKYDEAVKEFGPHVILYFTYKAMNRLVQGSSADMIKKAMIDCYHAGHLPCMTIHDELDFCDIQGPKDVQEISEIMVNCVKLLVPIKLDVELGPSWGECEECF